MNTTRRNYLRLTGIGGGALLTGAVTAHAAGESDPLALFAMRRSVRNYKSDPVPEDHLRRILDAARRCPTSGNQQPWKFLVVRDRSKIERLKARWFELWESRVKDMTAAERESRKADAVRSMTGYFSAPVYIVVLTDSQSTYPSYNHHDGPLAAGYLMLAARALGYGTVYMTDTIPEQVTRDVLAIPERYRQVCVTPLGVPVAWPEASPKKKLEELVAYEKL